ncbi:FtsX-like permease family protein [uncultured Planktosalinus sp.]|uniref:FtsX-like permease family protein n=1 Tax=uncultured Planktosalinus sp. TaxID=1810935 RepID=UPI0030DC21B7
MRFSFYIAKRYLFSKSSNNAINIITVIAATGVVVGAMSLFIVLSGFSGLKDFSLQFSSVFDSDLKVFPENGKIIQITPKQENQLNEIAGIVAYSKIIEERVFLTFKGKNFIANIKGVDRHFQSVNSIDSTLIVGGWMQNPNESVVGNEISRILSLGVYDYSDLLDVYVPKPGTGQITDPNQAFNKTKVVVSGIYHVNEELNSKYVFTSLDLAKNLLAYSDEEFSSIEIKLTPETNEEELIAQLGNILNQPLIFKNRLQQNDALYKMLNTENLAVYLIFTLVLIIAVFNIIASIIMIILDKKHNIKTLKHLGSTIQEIRRIFYIQGVFMTVLGGVLGIILGIIIVLLQLQFDLIMITSTLPYPIKLEFTNVLIVLITIFVLGVLASKIAASRVKNSLIS